MTLVKQIRIWHNDSEMWIRIHEGKGSSNKSLTVSDEGLLATCMFGEISISNNTFDIVYWDHFKAIEVSHIYYFSKDIKFSDDYYRYVDDAVDFIESNSDEVCFMCVIANITIDKKNLKIRLNVWDRAKVEIENFEHIR